MDGGCFKRRASGSMHGAPVAKIMHASHALLLRMHRC